MLFPPPPPQLNDEFQPPCGLGAIGIVRVKIEAGAAYGDDIRRSGGKSAAAPSRTLVYVALVARRCAKRHSLVHCGLGAGRREERIVQQIAARFGSAPAHGDYGDSRIVGSGLNGGIEIAVGVGIGLVKDDVGLRGHSVNVLEVQRLLILPIVVARPRRVGARQRRAAVLIELGERWPRAGGAHRRKGPGAVEAGRERV